jgi:hypothetical protein
MPSNQFTYYVQRASKLLEQGQPRLPSLGGRASEFSDEVWSTMNSARAEELLSTARARLANKLSADCVRLWMRPEFFPTPYCSIAATLTGHLVVPATADQPELQQFFDVLRKANFPMRWAIAEAMEAAFYHWLPMGASVEDTFSTYGMPLIAGKT